MQDRERRARRSIDGRGHHGGQDAVRRPAPGHDIPAPTAHIGVLPIGASA